MVTSIGRPAAAELHGPFGVGVARDGVAVSTIVMTVLADAESNEGSLPKPGDTRVLSMICVKGVAVVAITAGVPEPLDTWEGGIQEQDSNSNETRLKIIHNTYFFINNKSPLQTLILPQFHHLI